MSLVCSCSRFHRCAWSQAVLVKVADVPSCATTVLMIQTVQKVRYPCGSWTSVDVPVVFQRQVPWISDPHRHCRDDLRWGIFRALYTGAGLGVMSTGLPCPPLRRLSLRVWTNTRVKSHALPSSPPFHTHTTHTHHPRLSQVAPFVSVIFAVPLCCRPWLALATRREPR